MATDRPTRAQFLTVAEVADLMRVSNMTVYRMVHAGELRAVRVSRSYRIPQDAVEEYLATHSGPQADSVTGS